jgi:hypothetical protein
MNERVAQMEVKIEHLEERTDKLEAVLDDVKDIAKTTKTQLLVGVGIIVGAINLLARFF